MLGVLLMYPQSGFAVQVNHADCNVHTSNRGHEFAIFSVFGSSGGVHSMYSKIWGQVSCILLLLLLLLIFSCILGWLSICLHANCSRYIQT